MLTLVPKSYWVGSQYILGVMIDRFQGVINTVFSAVLLMTQIFNERLAVIWRCSKNPGCCAV